MIAVVSMPRSFAQTPIGARKTTKPTVPARAATPSLSVKPIATPMAKSNGRLAKSALPDAAMICDTISGSHEKLALPTPSRMPATGNTDTGSIMHLPTFCRSEKAFLNDGIFISRLVRLTNQCAYFRSGFGDERFLRKLLAFIETQFANLSFDRGNRRKTDAQFIDVEPDQNRHAMHIARDTAANRDRSVGGMTAAHG